MLLLWVSALCDLRKFHCERLTASCLLHDSRDSVLAMTMSTTRLRPRTKATTIGRKRVTTAALSSMSSLLLVRTSLNGFVPLAPNIVLMESSCACSRRPPVPVWYVRLLQGEALCSPPRLSGMDPRRLVKRMRIFQEDLTLPRGMRSSCVLRSSLFTGIHVLLFPSD